MRAMVIGADSVIGRGLIAALAAEGEVVATSRRPGAFARGQLQLDLSAPDLEAMRLPRADVAFFCAAITGFAACRRQPALAHRINVTAPATLARRLASAGTHVVLLSTNAVFSTYRSPVPAGELPSPLTVYGKHKAEAEVAFAGLGAAVTILRLTKVLAPDAELFLGWIDALTRGERIVAFGDMQMAPITLDDALAALVAVARARSAGILQVSGAAAISYAEAARHLARRLGVPVDLVEEASGLDAGFLPEELGVAPALDSSRLTAVTGWQPPAPAAVLDAVYGAAIADSRRHRGIGP